MNPEQVAFLEQHIQNQEDAELLSSLLAMSGTELEASACSYDRCLYLPMITMEQAESEIAANPWIGPDGRLLD